VGAQSAIALRADGTAITWGPITHVPGGRRPQAVASSERFVEVDADYYNVAAVTSDGRLVVWGDNSELQLGLAAPLRVDTPTETPVLRDVVQVETGMHTVALRGDGTVWQWGAAAELLVPGAGFPWHDSHLPLEVPGLIDVVQISHVHKAAYALDAQGTVWVWGSIHDGTDGSGRPGLRRLVRKPEPVPGLPPIREIASGELWAWGGFSGDWGPGDGSRRRDGRPVRIATGLR
jgi:hypothetical protein